MAKIVFLVVRMVVKMIFGTHFHSYQARYGLQLRVEMIPMGIVCLHLELFRSEQVPRNGTLKAVIFTCLKKNSQKNWNNQSAHLCSVVSNDHLIVAPFYETME
jgi:hypothetical protein